MADRPSSPATLDASSNPPNLDSSSKPTPQPDQPPSALAAALPSLTVNPNPNPAVPAVSPAPSVMTSFAAPISGVPPAFRPPLQFSPITNFQNPSVRPPGVNSAPMMAPGSVPPPAIQYQVAPGQIPNSGLRPFTAIPNGYAAVPGAAPPGVPRYSMYPVIARPAFLPRPPGAVGVLPRPLVPGMPGIRPVIPPIVRPAALPSVTPAEKPQTTVYVGKIAPTVDNDFMLSLLLLCGPVKSWKRQDLTDGTPRGFGFCEFETAEGLLRALRLLGKLAIDGQELVLNVNQATRGYLEQYVEKKKENAKKVKETEVAESGNSAVDGKSELLSTDDSSKQSEPRDKEDPDPSSLGIVTEEDQVADREASEKLANMIEERLKDKPLPPPPPMSGLPDGSVKSNAEVTSRSRDGDSDIDAKKYVDGTEIRNNDETISNSRAASVHGRPDASSPDRRHDRRSRDRDREHDMKREKEREIERLERETERERVRKEREHRRKIEEAEREYDRYLREWEQREREKEKQRQYEKEKEKERERKRKKEIFNDEEGEDDDSRKRWRRSALEEKRRKRLREKEEDLVDRLKEEGEIAEAKVEEDKSQHQQYEALRFLSARSINGGEKSIAAEESSGKDDDMVGEQDQFINSSHENQSLGVGTFQNGSLHESNMAVSDGQNQITATTKKLGFGLLGSGKRTTVPSVFHEEEDAQKEKKMRPLVPIDYSNEELQAVQPSVSGAMPPNLVAAAEFAKRISTVDHKEEKNDTERERNRRSSDKSTRDKEKNNDDSSRTREESKEKNMDRDRDRGHGVDRDRGHGVDKSKTTDNQKFLDAKQLIDMIPKTKEELFSFEINWDVYDKHDLHERMRPWISKKITEFLGEEEKTLVDYIVSSTQEHVKASRMLEQLQTILDEEAEMFVLKMWRMLIFEIKKVETGLALRPKS